MSFLLGAAGGNQLQDLSVFKAETLRDHRNTFDTRKSVAGLPLYDRIFRNSELHGEVLTRHRRHS